MTRIQCFLTTTLIMQASVTAFTPQVGLTHSRHSAIELQSNFDPENEVNIMAKARECADSETCSIDEAESYLQDVLRLQSACGSMSLDASYLGVCEDITIPNDIIASLRYKIETTANTPANALTIKYMMTPVFASMFAVYLASSIANLNHQPGVDAFTMQEVWWAARDGYLSDLANQFVKNGGLSTVDLDSVVVLPFTSDEWMSSMKDGYLGTMMTSNLKNGGLSAVDIDTAAVLPITSDEWMWSIRDGYFGNLMSTYLKNGGL